MLPILTVQQRGGSFSWQLPTLLGKIVSFRAKVEKKGLSLLEKLHRLKQCVPKKKKITPYFTLKAACSLEGDH